MKKIIRATTVPSSLATFCKGMLKELSEKYEVVALSSPGEDLNSFARQEGVRAITVPMERHISIAKDFKSLWLMCRVLKKENPYMVHSMTPKAGLICMIAAWLVHIPVRIHTFTGLIWPTSTGLKRKVLMLTDKLTCCCATHIIPEGEGVKSDLIKGRITTKPLTVLGNGNVMGVNLDFFSRRPQVLKIVKNKELCDEYRFTFLFVGRIVRDKGIDELVSAFGRLQKDCNTVRLLLVGSYEDGLDSISDGSRELIEKNPDIRAVGPKMGDELVAYYAAADCFVFPSYREGFPNVVLEAGAMGLPSIVTNINGSREIIIDKENGIIIPPRDEKRLYEAMKFMLSSDSDRNRMAGNARTIISSKFEQSFVRKCLYDFYDVVLLNHVS